MTPVSQDMKCFHRKRNLKVGLFFNRQRNRSKVDGLEDYKIMMSGYDDSGLTTLSQNLLAIPEVQKRSW